MSAPVVTAANVRKKFENDGVLNGVDLVVEAGEVLVLMGPNGVGKSVLLSCLAGSEPPSAGTVDVCGTAEAGRNGAASFLLQEAIGIDRLSGRENLDFYSRLHPRFTDAWREYAERLDIVDALDKRVENYSGGMTRKLELAISLSIDVPVYFLDEPTAGLDLSVMQTVHAIVRELRTAGKTVVVTSHLPMDADLADRIAFLRDGEIVTTGAPDDLMASLPPVVRVSSTEAASTLTDHVRAGELFSDGGEVRGFLCEDADVSDAEAAVGDTARTGEHRVVETEPTYTDLFNYYTKLDRPEAR